MSNLRQVAMAMTTYGNDFNHYPEAVEPWDGNSWFGSPRERTWRMGKGSQYNLNPLYRNYLGGPLDGAFKCPLACNWYYERNQDNNHLSSYMIYPSNNRRSKHFYTKEGWTRPGKGFVADKDTAKGYTFKLLASDYAFWGAYEGCPLVSGHPALGRTSGAEHRAPINSVVGWWLNSGQITTANYASDDGSVKSYVISDTSGDNPSYFLWADRFMVPAEAAR
jgi:hypothetical protein